MAAKFFHQLIFCYTIMLFIRIIGSWFPRYQHHRLMQFIIHYTEPYLGLFRRLLPPIGGVLDLSPILGFLVLRILDEFLGGIL